MDWTYLLAFLIPLLMVAYLGVALLLPEKFS